MEELSSQVEEFPPTVEQVSQPSQVQVSLRRSVRERRSIISRDYVYFYEHEFNIGLKSDLISFRKIK